MMSSDRLAEIERRELEKVAPVFAAINAYWIADCGLDCGEDETAAVVAAMNAWLLAGGAER